MLSKIKKIYYNTKFYFKFKSIKKNIKISNDCKIYIIKKKVNYEYIYF